MNRALIITYYWPPAGGPGVQRVLKFTKYLPDFGWQPIVLTVQDGEYPATDGSLVDEIIPLCRVYRTKSFQPYRWYRRFTGIAREETIPTSVLADTRGLNWKKRLSHWVRANLFIPDAHIGWLPYAVKTGYELIKRERINVLFSSSPPPTAHLIAQELARKSGLTWVADFRDPWTDIHYYEHVLRSRITQRLDSKLEASVLQAASVVTSISQTDISRYRIRVPQTKYVFLPNGFDSDDFEGVDVSKRSSKFCIMHLGTMGKERNPKILFEVLSDLIKRDEFFGQNVSLTLVGIVEDPVQMDIERYGLRSIVRRIPYLPHSEALRYMAEATILLLPITNTRDNRGIVPGKMFEYLGARKPILGYGHVCGDAAQILQQTDAGCVLAYDDYEGTRRFLIRSYIQWGGQEPLSGGDISEISTFDRRHLTESLAQIFEALVRSGSDRRALKR